MKEFEAVLFDFDGVIVDSEIVHFECWQEILEPFEITLTWDYYTRNCIGVSDRAMIRTLISLREPPVDFDRVYALYPAKKERFRARMMESPRADESTIELLRQLSGYKKAVVTSSGRAEVEPILRQLGIADLFDAAVYGEDVAALKPSPEPYLKAAEKLGITRALVVEDSAAGRESGRAAGFEVIEIEQPSGVAERVRARLGI